MLRLLAAASILLGSLAFSVFAPPAWSQAPPAGNTDAPAQTKPTDANPPAAKKADENAGDDKSAAKPAPAPPPKVLNVVVAGDSIADGIWGGLFRKLQRDKRYSIVREAKNSSGLTAYDWQGELQAILARQPADAVVFLVGTNDRQTLIVKDKPRTLFRTPAWEEGYVERVNALMKFAVERKIPLVWVSLPIARKPEFNKDSEYLNAIYAKAAKENGIIYIDIWPMFADPNGEYAAYLPDATGKKHLLRHNDGVHFTPQGYEMIADAVLASLQKNVPAFAEPAAAAPDKPADKQGDTKAPDEKKADEKKPDDKADAAKPTPADGNEAKKADAGDGAAGPAPPMNAMREPKPKATQQKKRQ